MLLLDQIEMDTLTLALEFNSDFGTSWWLDPETGEILLYPEDGAAEADESAADLDERGTIKIEAVSSREGYQYMETFISGLDDGRAKDRLWQAINGSRPFRHFKDTLMDFPALSEQWYAFHDEAVRRYAIEWLVDVGAVDKSEAEKALKE
ncbi:UPF0158 family protein [Paenarthrobacter sp. PH39-S1]|uniref:UPF0158 family protein n=1 Tax=Paenarthrobacter sp. PH39-S1 TaxID=3046204 RepID=UPI0024BA57C3|nr:UPF0158 family protein [Paenarthrobacter sp. PH39-S1]MDJ0355314.1 UPF0158 family protein [Paenarthrobacter sp. PH39-S1]